MKRILISAAVLGLGISTVGIASADKPGDTDTTKTSNKYQERDCGDGDIVALDGPDTLWPPNHKMVDQSATATDGDDGDPLTNPTDDASNATSLTLTPSVMDAVGGDGGPQHGPDWNFPAGPTASGDPSATVPFQVRAERSGKGEGRTYTFDWVATFDGIAGGLSGKTCSSADEGQTPFTIFVPHDQGKGNDA